MKNLLIVILLVFLISSVAFVFCNCNSVFAKSGTADKTVKLDNPLGDSNPNPQQLIGKIINAVLGIVGSLALVMFIYGGFTWMMAGGNSEAVTKGKNVLVWATIGLIVIFTSYALVHFIIFEGLGAT